MGGKARPYSTFARSTCRHTRIALPDKIFLIISFFDFLGAPLPKAPPDLFLTVPCIHLFPLRPIPATFPDRAGTKYVSKMAAPRFPPKLGRGARASPHHLELDHIVPSPSTFLSLSLDFVVSVKEVPLSRLRLSKAARSDGNSCPRQQW